MSHNPSFHPPIPIGIEDYKVIVDKKSAYIDKTLLIKELWEDGAPVILIPRPRRFGKTLNLSMLKYFFEKTNQNTSYLFEKTNIWKNPEYRALQGQFPVIFLTFKDIKVDTWESAHTEFADLLRMNIEKLLIPAYQSLTFSEQEWYTRLINRSATDTDYTNSILFTTIILERHYKKKVIILIDEYDAPIIYAYQQNYYEKMIKFMDNLLSKALKSNIALEKGLLTGITRIAKAGIFSGLNHLSVCTVLQDKYSDKFGFTQKEVDQLLALYDLSDKKEGIKLWYDGYVFGQTNMYNPWSLISCIEQKGALKPYWVNTSNNDLITNIIANASQEVKDEIELLLEGNMLPDKEIDENVTHTPLFGGDPDISDIDKKNQEPWSFLLFAGYLTATSYAIIDDNYCYTLAIPNREIVKLYRALVLEALNATISFARLTNLFEAFISGDKKMVEYYLQEFVADTCSSHDTRKDDLECNFYKSGSPPLDGGVNMFVLGLLAGLSDRYIIQSNRESGDGRYDIMLMPQNKCDPGILIEFKKATSDTQKTLATAAKKALEQIKNLDYKAQLKTFGYLGPIFCYGIAACGKRLVVNMDSIHDNK